MNHSFANQVKIILRRGTGGPGGGGY